jgi:capsular exopolysaccharide synthesis family protein
VQLNELQRRADSIRETYQAYLDRYQQNLSSLGSEQADVRVVASAVANNVPVAPKMRMYALVGVLLGLAAGFGAALLLTLLDTRVSTPREVENALDVDTLPSIMTLESIEGKAAARASADPVSFIVAEPLSAFAEQFRNLLAAILSRGEGGKAKVIAVTSALPGEGKTTTTLCMAAVAAMGGRRALLIDCDVRRRSASQFVEQRTNRGLSEVLKREATVQEAVISHAGAGFDVLPLSTAAVEARDLLGSPAMEGLLADLRGTYDLILLDTPPVLPVADTRLLVRHVDVTGLLVRWRSTPIKAAEAALDIVADVAPNIAGVALSMVDLRKQSRQGYGDPAYYHKKYKKYYSVSAAT